jgi:haloalkane dehalogenase
MTKGKFVEVLGSKMHYLEAGEGEPILFLHGIPMSSYLWRNIIPHLAPLGRCIAPDLIGFGQSAKPDIAYTVQDHINYIEKFIEALGLKHITLVMHGWGSVVGFDYAMRHEANCKGLVFYEAFLRTLEAYDEALPFQEQVLALHEQENMTELVMNSTAFIDKIISPLTIHDLSEEELENYRKPFSKVGDGKPVLQYINELPNATQASTVDNLIANYTKKLTHSDLPKLLLYSVPGFVTTIATVMWAKKNLPRLEIVDIGEELHLAQETNPTLIGETISIWLQSVEQQASASR